MTEASSDRERETPSVADAARQRIGAERGIAGEPPDATGPALAAEIPIPRVQTARCAACGAPITRVHTYGPLPRYCPRCRAWLRDRQRLRGYLKSGLHLAEALGLEAIAALDGLGYGRRP